MQPGWIRRHEITDHCGVSESTVDRWLRAGLPHKKPSRRMVLVKREDLDKWIASLDQCGAECGAGSTQIS